MVFSAIPKRFLCCVLAAVVGYGMEKPTMTTIARWIGRLLIEGLNREALYAGLSGAGIVILLAVILS